MRRVETVETVFSPLGCGGGTLDEACITDALVVAEGIGELQGSGEYNRVW